MAKASFQTEQMQQNRSLLVKIAPKPSPMHLTAAIALSELAGDANDDGERKWVLKSEENSERQKSG